MSENEPASNIVIPEEVRFILENSLITRKGNTVSIQEEMKEYYETKMEEIGRRASKVWDEKESLYGEVNDLTATKAEQAQELEAQTRQIRELETEIKEKAKLVSGLEEDLQKAGDQHEHDTEEKEKLHRKIRPLRMEQRKAKNEIAEGENRIVELEESLKQSNALIDQQRQRVFQLGEGLQNAVSKEETQNSKFEVLKEAFRTMTHIDETLHDVMAQEEVDSCCSSRSSSSIGVPPQVRTLDEEMADIEPCESNDDGSNVGILDTQSSRSKDGHAHPLFQSQGSENEMNFRPDGDTATESSSSHNFPPTLDSELAATELDSSMDDSDHPRMSNIGGHGHMSCSDEDTEDMASSSDHTDASSSDERIPESNTTCSEHTNYTDHIEEIIRMHRSITPVFDGDTTCLDNDSEDDQTDSMSTMTDEQFDMHHSSENSSIDLDTQGMDWEPTGWHSPQPRTLTNAIGSPVAYRSCINHPHLKRPRGELVDDSGCLSEKQKRRSNSLMTHPPLPFTIKKPGLRTQTTQTAEITVKASVGCQTDELSMDLDDSQVAQKPENPRPPSSHDTNTSTGVQTTPQETETPEQGIQPWVLTEIPGHEVQMVAPQKHISHKKIPCSHSVPVLLAPLSGTATRVKRRLIEGFKLLTNIDQDKALASHQNRVQATPPSLQDDTVHDYPETESMSILMMDNEAYIEHIIMQWVEHVLQWIIRWMPFIIMALAWLLYMWWTDDQWQLRNANEVPRNVFEELRRGYGNEYQLKQMIDYELGKYRNADRVALG